MKKNSPLTYLACIVLAVALVILVFATTPIIEHNHGFDTDGSIYGTMAGSELFSPNAAHLSPWCYRVLTPYTAALLPWSTLNNFRAIALVSNIISLIILFLLLQKLNFTPGIALFGVLLYAGTFWTLKFSFYSPAYIDHQTQMFLLLLLYLTISGRYILLIPVLVLSALQKESLVVYSLFAMAHMSTNQNQQKNKRQSLALASAIVLCPAITLLLIRLHIKSSTPFDFFILHDQMKSLLNWRFLPRFALAIFSGLGLIPIIIMLKPRTWIEFLRKHKEWILFLVFAATFLLSGCDKARLFLYALPCMVLLALHVVSDLKQTHGSSYRFFVWAIITLAIHFFMGNYLTPIGNFHEYLTKLVPTYAPGNYLTILARNCILSLIWLASTLLLLPLHVLHGKKNSPTYFSL
ncbi:MAG: hypothetical protein KAH23_07495 [Kiritimatiellae bacterium]|nr:hypothetical protein [Kiritimatiellia bacterium]